MQLLCSGLMDCAEQIVNRRRALDAVAELSTRIAALHSAANKATELADQVRMNLEIQRLRSELRTAETHL